MASEITEREEIAEILRTARTVAVLGAHRERERPAFYVPDYLYRQGYIIVPVNPTIDGMIWNEPIVPTLPEVDRPIDVVDVFRNAKHIPGHTGQILAMDPLPRVVWLQQGIRSDEAARKLIDAGIDVVQDRCMLADHKAMEIGPVSAD